MQACQKGKVAYASLDEAKAGVRRAMLRVISDRAKKFRATGIKDKLPRIRPYICGYCGQWHIGRGPKGADADWGTRRLFIRSA